MLALPGAVVVSNRTALRHSGLHRQNLSVQLVLCGVVPRQLVQVLAAVSKECVRGCLTGGNLDQASVSEGLQTMRIMRSFGDFARLLLDGNEFRIDDDDRSTRSMPPALSKSPPTTT